VSQKAAADDGKTKTDLISKFLPRADHSPRAQEALSGSQASPPAGAGTPRTPRGWATPLRSPVRSQVSDDHPHTACLADSLFLVGPSEQDIEAAVQEFFTQAARDAQTRAAAAAASMRQPAGPPGYPGGPPSRYGKASGVSVSLPGGSTYSLASSGGGGGAEYGREKESLVEPKLLYITSKDPDMEHVVLPFFCFPTGVNVRVSGAARSSNDGVAAAAAATAASTDFALPDNDAAPVAYPSAIGNSRCFAFLLNNNANQRQVLQTSTQTHKFGVCLLVQRSFRDHARGVIVTCEYCICLVSALPFLGFLFHLLIQFEACGGLELNAPVRAYESPDDNELFRPPELRMLSELARRLRSVHVPMFPSARVPPDAAGGGSPSPDAPPEMTFAPLKFAMVVRTGGATPRSSIVAALPSGTGPLPNASPSTSSVATRSRSPSIVATAASAAHNNIINQPPSRLPPNYVASTATGVVKPVTKLTKKHVVGTFGRDLMAPFCSLPPVPRDPDAVPATLFPAKPPSPSRSQYAARAAYGLTRALSSGANLSTKRVRRMIPLLEEEREKEACFHTLLWALPVLLRHLTLDQIISVVGWAMTEMRVVVVGKDLAVVSGIVLALINLLRPLKWAGPVIVSVPASMHAYVDSPVPLILGMQVPPIYPYLGPYLGPYLPPSPRCSSACSRSRKGSNCSKASSSSTPTSPTRTARSSSTKPTWSSRTRDGPPRPTI